MKSFLLALVIVFLIAGYVLAAGWNVTVNWTPSPNAVSEILLLLTDGVEQEQVCPQPATCTFSVADLTGQTIIIRSLNSQGGGIDYEAGKLSILPDPASNAVIVITPKS